MKSDSSEEYGKTMKDAWIAFTEAGSRTADVHVELSKELINNPVNSIKEWIKTNYQKHVFNFKKTKEFEENFQMGIFFSNITHFNNFNYIFI